MKIVGKMGGYYMLQANNEDILTLIYGRPDPNYGTKEEQKDYEILNQKLGKEILDIPICEKYKKMIGIINNKLTRASYDSTIERIEDLRRALEHISMWVEEEIKGELDK